MKTINKKQMTNDKKKQMTKNLEPKARNREPGTVELLNCELLNC